MSERKHPEALCEQCPLYEKGKYVSTTFPASDPNNIAIIGEAPGRNEVRKGQVFIGMSGQVLDGVFQHHGIKRDSLTLTNAMACHYPERDFPNGPPMAAIDACRPRLVSELEEANVDLAVTVGASAAKSLIKSKTGITKLRAGLPRKSDFSDKIDVIPTFHPAAALRDQSKFKYINNDFGKIDRKWDEWKSPRLVVLDSENKALPQIEHLIGNTRGPLVVDTESGSEKDESYGGGINEVLCIGIWDDALKVVLVFAEESLNSKKVRDRLAELFVRRGIVAQNGKYDVGRCLNVFLGDVEIPVAFDTMLASYCLDESSGVHGLEYMSSEYLGAPLYKSEFHSSLDKRDFGTAEAGALYSYNAADVWNTNLLKDRFSEKLVKGRVDGLHKWLLTISDALVRVEARGLAVDMDYNAQLEAEYDELIRSIDFGDAENINPNSPKQVTKYLDGLRVRVESTNKATLAELIDKHELTGRDDVVGFCKALLEHRGASKLKSTYITGLRKNLVNGRAHPTFLLHGTTTGRLSCRAPNLQNIPRGSAMRNQFVPSAPDRVFVQCDYGQAELRCLTYFGKDEFMRDLFNDPDKDVFVDLCRSLFGIETYESGDAPAKKEMRTLTKTFAYGVSYGREAKSIAKAFDMSVVAAKRKMNEFYDMIPDIMEYQRGIKRKVMNQEDLVNPFGRRRRFYLITDLNKREVFNEAMAFMPQSTASDICLEAFVRLDSEGYDIRNLVHDSIMAECHVSEAQAVGQRMRQVMIQTAEEITEGYVKFDVDIEVGQSWGSLAS